MFDDPVPEPLRRMDLIHRRAAAASARASSRSERVERIIRTLAVELVEFQDVSVRISMRYAGLDHHDSMQHILRLVRLEEIMETRPDWYAGAAGLGRA